MFRRACASLVTLSTLAIASPTTAVIRPPELARYDGGEMPYGMSMDCVLEAANICSGWIWVMNDVEGAIWGTVLNPQDCPGEGCNGIAVREIYAYVRCAVSPARIGSIGIATIDGKGCLSAMLYESGPITTTHCLPDDRWITIEVPPVPLRGDPFAVTLTWGPGSAVADVRFSLDNGLANLYCSQGVGGFPGCAESEASCGGWTLPPQNSFIYVTDFNGDGVLDDLCELYGVPYPLNFPYGYTYSYIPNNLVIGVGLVCSGPSGVEPTSWGRVKALFE